MQLPLTGGIVLTEVRRCDQDALVEYLNDREIYDRTLRIPSPYRPADALQWLDAVENLNRPDGVPANWAIRNAAGKLIGGVGLEASGVTWSHRAEIGYWLAKPFWGQGLMTAAVQAVCGHAFDHLGLEKITAHVLAANHASARVLQKCGFEQEGFCPAHFRKDGKLIDIMLFGLLRQASGARMMIGEGFAVRAYRHDDEAQVVQLWQTVFPDSASHNDPLTDIRRKLNVQRNLFLVGEAESEIVATVMAGFDGNRGWLHRVAVAPACRRRGFGRVLVAEAERRLAELGCAKVNLQVHVDNQPAVEFYESLGYRIEDRVSMGKRLVGAEG